MATDILFFKGKTKWARVHKPSENFETYEVPVYMDKKELKRYQDSGMQLQIREDEDGSFVTFKRKHAEFNGLKKEQVINGRPGINILKDGAYVPFDGLIGNGSEVTVKVEVYDTPGRGKGKKGHRLLAVGVDKLVEYVAKEKEVGGPDMPF